MRRRESDYDGPLRSPVCPPECLAGRAAKSLPPKQFHVLDKWTLNGKVYEDCGRFSSRTRPCIVLATREHVADLTALDSVERSQLGQLLLTVHAELLVRSRAANVFVLYLNPKREHVHIHFVPNYAEDLGREAQVLLEKDLPPNVTVESGAEIASAIAELLRSKGHTSVASKR